MKLYTYQEIDKLNESWVSVKDALPPPGVEVIVYKPESEHPHNKITALARYIRYEGCNEALDYWWDNRYPGHGNMNLPESITHWRLMPKLGDDNGVGDTSKD